jgi:phage baseplate assembly protein W
MQVDYPFRLDPRGRSAMTAHDEHVRDLVEQVLFTAPGERVNRPEFGSGLMQLVFDPARDELATATQLLVRGSLQRWLSDLIRVEDTTVEIHDSQLRVTVVYVLIRTQEERVASFARDVR